MSSLTSTNLVASTHAFSVSHPASSSFSVLFAARSFIAMGRRTAISVTLMPSPFGGLRQAASSSPGLRSASVTVGNLMVLTLLLPPLEECLLLSHRQRFGPPSVG